MGVPASIADLSTTAGSNSPLGSDTITDAAGPDDYLRAHAAIIKTHTEATAEHGATGAVVGTTNSQTLTNKTLTAPVINGTVTTTGLTMPAFTSGTINGTTIPTSKTLVTTDDITPTGSATEIAEGIVELATQAEAEAGVSNTVVLTALRTKQAITANALPAATASVNGYMTSVYAAKLDGIAAGATVGVPVDVGVSGVGLVAMMYNKSGGTIASNATTAGSNLKYAVENTGSLLAGTTSPAGTWRNITPDAVTSNLATWFQRIS